MVVVLAVLLFGYWALMYWGWKKDRQEAQTASSNLQSKNRADLYRKAKEQGVALPEEVRARPASKQRGGG